MTNQSILIEAPRLFDGKTDQYLNDTFLVLEGDEITAVGRLQELGADREQRFGKRIQLSADSTLLPGLINMHTHLSFSSRPTVYEDALHESDPIKMIRMVENLRACLEVGVTTVRDCGTWPHLALPARDAIESGLLLGPRMIASGANYDDRGTLLVLRDGGR